MFDFLPGKQHKFLSVFPGDGFKQGIKGIQYLMGVLIFLLKNLTLFCLKNASVLKSKKRGKLNAKLYSCISWWKNAREP